MSKTLNELKARQARYLNWLEQQDYALRKLRSTFADDQRIIENIISDYKLELADLDRAIAALEAPAQPLDELRTDPGAEEESRDQSEPDATPAEDFTLLDPAVLNIDEPVLDATILPQVTPDEVPPTAEVIHTDDGRKRFALFGGQTHEVVSGSGNPDADFWASVLHPKPKVDA